MIEYVLASASPRRSDLLKEVVTAFEVIPAKTEEIINEQLEIYDAIKEIALEKALDVSAKQMGKVVIAADTVVFCEGTVLLKPVDFDDAFSILKLLSENIQEVITGVAICKGNQCKTFYDVTTIEFQNIDDEWITSYINEYQPFDKSGSYGIQEISSEFIKRLDGDITNVIGLPLKKLKTEIEDFIKANV